MMQNERIILSPGASPIGTSSTEGPKEAVVPNMDKDEVTEILGLLGKMRLPREMGPSRKMVLPCTLCLKMMMVLVSI